VIFVGFKVNVCYNKASLDEKSDIKSLEFLKKKKRLTLFKFYVCHIKGKKLLAIYAIKVSHVTMISENLDCVSLTNITACLWHDRFSGGSHSCVIVDQWLHRLTKYIL